MNLNMLLHLTQNAIDARQSSCLTCMNFQLLGNGTRMKCVAEDPSFTRTPRSVTSLNVMVAKELARRGRQCKAYETEDRS